MITKYIKRHSVLARITHGVVAISCILLAISGLFVLITAWNNGVGSEFTIAMRWTHRLLAIPFILIPLLAIIISPKGFVHLFKNNIFGKWDADDRTFAMRFIPYLFTCLRSVKLSLCSVLPTAPCSLQASSQQSRV